MWLGKNNSSIIRGEEWSNNSEVLNAPLPWVLIPQSSCLQLIPEGVEYMRPLGRRREGDEGGEEGMTFPCSLLQYYSRKRIGVLVKDDPYSRSAVRATDLLVPRIESLLLLIWVDKLSVWFCFVWFSSHAFDLIQTFLENIVLVKDNP